MQITIPAPTTYTKVDDGVYKGSDGNLYHNETVLRYRVMRKYLKPPYNSSGWSLFSSHSKQESAVDTMFDNLKEDFYDYKIVDNGEATTIKRLLY